MHWTQTEKAKILSLCAISFYCLGYCSNPLSVRGNSLSCSEVSLCKSTFPLLQFFHPRAYAILTGRIWCIVNPSIICLQLHSKILPCHCLPDYANYICLNTIKMDVTNAEKWESKRQQRYSDVLREVWIYICESTSFSRNFSLGKCCSCKFYRPVRNITRRADQCCSCICCTFNSVLWLHDS